MGASTTPAIGRLISRGMWRPCVSGVVDRARLERPLCTRSSVARPTLVPNGHLFCGGCGRAKPLHEFYVSNHSMCAECFRAYRREHYVLNCVAYIERNTRVLRNRQLAWH